MRVMLADDHAALREGLRALFLTEPGVEVVDEVGDVNTALDRVRNVMPDVLVLDLSMPHAGGLAAIPQIKAAHPRTAIVVLTRHRDLGFVRAALNAGALGYVLKQSSFEELRRAMTMAVKGEQYIDSLLRSEFDAAPIEFKGHVSNREHDVLRRTVLGQSNKEIAAALQITVRTVEVHKTHGMRKLDLPDRSALVRYAVLHGWLFEP